jgi:hypothetical protein
MKKVLCSDFSDRNFFYAMISSRLEGFCELCYYHLWGVYFVCHMWV